MSPAYAFAHARHRHDARSILNRMVFLLAVCAATGIVASAPPVPTTSSASGRRSRLAADRDSCGGHARRTRAVLRHEPDGTQTGYFKYDIWDPAAGLSGGHITLDNFTNTDLFCSSQVILPSSGSILISGGDNWTGTGTTNTGNNNSNIFDYYGRFAHPRQQHEPGPVVLLGHGADERRGLHPGRQRRRRPPGSAAAQRQLPPAVERQHDAYAATFPRNFLAPDGRVFGYDTNGAMYFVDPSGTGTLTHGRNRSRRNTSGGPRPPRCTGPARSCRWAATRTTPSSSTSPAHSRPSRSAQPMATQRQWVIATVIADGRVVATGGSAVDNQLTGVNNTRRDLEPGHGHLDARPGRRRGRGSITPARCCCRMPACSSPAAARPGRRSTARRDLLSAVSVRCERQFRCRGRTSRPRPTRSSPGQGFDDRCR